MRVRRRSLLFGGVAAAAAGAGIWRSLWGQKGGYPLNGVPGSRLGDAFWQMQLANVRGGELSLKALQGRPLIVNFWATWCPPCVAELPMLDAFFREHSVNGWHVVGLAIDHPESVQKFLARVPVSFDVAVIGMQGTALLRQLGNNDGSLPFTLVVNAGGTVLGRKKGQLVQDDLLGWLTAIGRA